MLLTAGDRLVIIASLQWAAMEHDKTATAAQKAGLPMEALRAAGFSRECARLADAFQKEK